MGTLEVRLFVTELPRRNLAEYNTSVCAPGEDTIADRIGARSNEWKVSRVSIVQIGRTDAGENRVQLERFKVTGDVLGALCGDRDRQQRVQFVFRQADR